MMSRRQLRRAFELIRARRFLRRLNMGPHRPGGWTFVPSDVRLEDVVMWQTRGTQR